MKFLAIVCSLLALAPGSVEAEDVGGGSAPGGSVTLVNGFLTEADILSAMGEGALENCFLRTIKVGESDFCTYYLGVIVFEMVCIRVDMNVPMAFVEASDRQGALSLFGNSLQTHMQELNKNQSPLEKTMIQRLGDFASASATTQGRCINMFVAASAFKSIMNGISMDVLCSPAFEYTRIPYGYAFASEGDHQNGTEFGNWRGIISHYWFVPWLTPFTAISRTIETPGLCAVDWFKLFCHGGWGTVYPSTGTNPAESQTMNLADSAYDALNPTFGFFTQYGPLHLRMGAMLVDFAHSSTSYQYGSTAMHAQMTRGGYIEPLFPTKVMDCYDTANVGNDVNPAMEVWMAQLASKPVNETNSNQITDAPKYSDQARNIAAALWPRFTCCNWCAGSIEAPAKHYIVGSGFWPQLISSSN
jgi:hypothetical protein